MVVVQVHNWNQNQSLKVFKFSSSPKLENPWSHLYVEQTSKLELRYMFFLKNVYQGKLGKCWYGLLGLNFYFILRIKTRIKIRLLFFQEATLHAKQKCYTFIKSCQLSLFEVSNEILKPSLHFLETHCSNSSSRYLLMLHWYIGCNLGIQY